MEHGDRIYKYVAQVILSKRRNAEKYPIYITDVDLSKSLLGNDYNDVQTAHYLKYKRLIESRLQEILDRQP